MDKAGPRVDFEDGDVQNGHVDASDHTHRRLKPRHIQLIGIAGTIGTALFVNIGKGLLSGGPAMPFEITVCNVVIRYWTEAIPVWAVCLVFLALYAILNFVAVKFFGEAEFWLSLGKVILIVGLISYTFVVMVGGNPRHDTFGFRYWYDPGAFRELYREGSLGRFLGFMYCLIQAAFVIAGPEYVSMTAGEAENPRNVLPKAYRSIFWRLTTFFILGSLAVGIVVPSDDPKLKEAYSSSKGGAAGSPYVRSMDILGIPILPHIVNALILTSAFSAGNSTTYCATRTLYGMALEGKAPRPVQQIRIFIDDNFTVPDFLFRYMIVGVFPVVFAFWKVLKKTKWLKPHEVDLTTGVWEIDVYTENFVPTPSKTAYTRALDKVLS
ncbi:General amino acid permease AGP2 [Colletotrichum sp. SAR 10_99]|nr:General amino acid permease AGP2 [Colletotrichum sp. SAR 10_99]